MSKVPHRSVKGLGAVGGTSVSLAAAVGLLVGLRSVTAVELPGVHSLVRLSPIPREGMGLSWTPHVVWPQQLQDAALDRMAALVATVFLAGAVVALVNALVLLLEAGSSRRREVAVRAAVGAGPRSLVGLLLRDVRRLLASAVVIGVLLGVCVGGVVRATWPGVLESVHAGPATALLLPVLSTLAIVAAAAYVRTGLVVARRARLAGELTVGTRATDSRGEAFLRRTLAAVQMGTAGAVALGTLALSLAVRGPEGSTVAASDTVSIEVRAPAAGGGAAWTALLERLRQVPRLEAESLATPGALVGLGVRDYATAQCGACYNGGMPMPFWGVRADHHAVGPGFFVASGVRVTSGRGITAADVATGKRVAVVNATFASAAFEKGDPLGHLVRLGSDLDAWFEVVGVVEDGRAQVLGGDDLAHAAVYVSALQEGMRAGSVLLRGPDGAIAAARAVLQAGGYRPGPPRTLAEARRESAAPLAWIARLALLLGLLTLGLAVHGVHASALQMTRRRTRELAVRRVLGATDRRLLAHTLGGSARGALWGSAYAVFFGSLLVGLLRQAAGGIPALGPAPYAAVATLLVGSALLASSRAAAEALAVEPARAVQ